MPMDYAALETELDEDPKTLGYAGKTDPPVADIMNTIAELWW